jgi:hypothetical protein
MHSEITFSAPATKKSKNAPNSFHVPTQKTPQQPWMDFNEINVMN